MLTVIHPTSVETRPPVIIGDRSSGSAGSRTRSVEARQALDDPNARGVRVAMITIVAVPNARVLGRLDLQPDR